MVIPPMRRWPNHGVGRVQNRVYHRVASVPPFAFPPPPQPFLCRPVGPMMVSRESAGPRRDGRPGVKLPSTSYFFVLPGNLPFSFPTLFFPLARLSFEKGNFVYGFREPPPRSKRLRRGDEAWRDEWSRGINSQMEIGVRIWYVKVLRASEFSIKFSRRDDCDKRLLTLARLSNSDIFKREST